MMKKALSGPPLKNASQSMLFMQGIYKECVNENKIEQMGSEPIRRFLDAMGGWPMLSENWKADIDVTTVLENTITHFGAAPFLRFSTKPDERNPTVNIYHIAHHGFILGYSRLSYTNDTANANLIQAYKTLAIDFAKIIGNDLKIKYNEQHIIQSVDEMYNFERDFVHMPISLEDRHGSEALYNKWSLAKLHGVSKVINFEKFFETIMPKDIYEKLVKGKTDKFEVIVLYPNLIKNLNDSLPKYKIETIINYAIFYVLKKHAGLLYSKIQQATQKFDKVHEGNAEQEERWKYCLSKAERIGRPYGAVFARKFYTNEDKVAAESMVESIMNAMQELLSKNTWLNDETRRYAKAKVSKMGHLVAYPDYLFDNDVLDSKFKRLDFSTSGAGYFDLYTRYLAWRCSNEFYQLIRDVDRNDFPFPYISAATVNAFYFAEMNKIFIPAGILHPPVFHRKYPPYIYYGSTGSLIGHEITHEFDNEGSQYDADGKLNSWWSADTHAQFEAKGICMTNQYDECVNPGTTDHVNGQLTLGENISDNSGLDEAFIAYEQHVLTMKNKPKELPFLKMSNEKAFFLSFAQMWCSKTTKELDAKNIKNDRHSPPIFRVNGAVSNSEEFAKAFNCAPNTKMNPDKKCTVW